MKRFLLISLLAVAALGQDITDLGVISRRRGVWLSAPTNRTDITSYVVEIQSAAMPTNTFKFTMTNEWLTIDWLGGAPSGPAIMGVKTIHSDGDESEIALFHVDIRRGEIGRPSARPSVIAAGDREKCLADVLRARRAQVTNAPAPLPGGTNATYGDRQIQLRRMYEEERNRRGPLRIPQPVITTNIEPPAPGFPK